MPETILAIPFNRKVMESMKTRIRKPSAEYIKTKTDRTIVSRPTTTSKPRSMLEKTLTNPPITTLAIL
jgi:hypothetical protein